MGGEFCFFIDNDFFNVDAFNIDLVRDYQTLIEIPRQLRADTYYDKNEFVELLNFIKDDKEFFTNQQDNLLKGFVKDFIGDTKKVNFFKIIFNNHESSLEFYSDSFITDKCIAKENIILSKDKDQHFNLLLIISQVEFYSISVRIVNNANQAWMHINSKLPKRYYKYHPKHGDVNSRCHKEESQLLTSEEETQQLLDSAIFNMEMRSKFHVNFDEEKNTYILFPKEGETPQNTFHAFHLDEVYWDEKIPPTIRKYFNR